MAQKKKVNWDGREYEFTPGKDGSFLHHGKPPTASEMSFDVRKRSKSVPRDPYFVMKTVNGKQVYTR